MEQDPQPRKDPQERSSGAAKARDTDGVDSEPTVPVDDVPGRQHLFDVEDSSTFWSEVDGMLTGEFSTDLLPKEGDYRLGAIDDSAGGPAPGQPLYASDPLFDTGADPAVGTAGAGSTRGGAHDVDPAPLDAEANQAVPSPGSGVFDHPAGGRLFPSDTPTVAAPSNPAPHVSSQSAPLIEPLTSRPAGPAGGVPLSPSAGGGVPSSLERSSVVGAGGGPPPGGTFLEDDLSPAVRRARVTGPATVNLEAGHATGVPAPTWHSQAPIYDSRSILLDVVDRQWLTSGLVVVAALSIGVIGWLLLLQRGDDGGAALLAASTTVSDPAGPDADGDAAEASRGAASGASDESTSSSTTTETTELETTIEVTARPRPRPTRAPTTAAPAPQPTPTATATTVDSSSTTSASTSSSSSDPTTSSTTDTTGGSTPTSPTVTTPSSTDTSDTPTSDTSDTSEPDDGGAAGGGGTAAP